MTQILIGNMIGCGGKFIRLFFELNTSLRVFKNVFPKPEADIIQFYDIESVRMKEIVRTDSILLFPVRDFFDHYLYLKTKYKSDYDSHRFVEHLLRTKEALDLLEKNIKIIPITIFKSPKSLIKDFERIMHYFLKQTLSSNQYKFIKYLDNVFNSSNKITEEMKLDLINSSYYEEVYEWYTDLYDESKLGI
jgi:hypothetical protein